MKGTSKLKFPGFYVQITDKTMVSNPKGWKAKGKKINVVNVTTNPRDNDIAEVIDIDTYTDGTRCFLCKDIDGFMFAVDEAGTTLFGKDWPDTAERIKTEYSVA